MKRPPTPGREARFDFFLCHASEDKNAVARPIAEALRAHGFRIWYDEFSLRVGDSLSSSIDRGLAESRFGVVILSRAFFRKKWTARELRGLVAREVDQKATILPIWHGVTKSEVMDFSPPLADVVAANTKNGLEAVLEALLQVVGRAEVNARGTAAMRGNYPAEVRDGLITLPPGFRRGVGDPAIVTSFTGESALVYPLDVWIETESRLDRGASSGRGEDVKSLKVARRFHSIVNVRKGSVQIREPLRTAARLFGDVDILGRIQHIEITDHESLLQRLRRDPFTDEDARALSAFGI